MGNSSSSRGRQAARLAVALLVVSAAVSAPLAESGVAAAGQIDHRFAGGFARVLTRSGGWSWFESPRATLTDCELIAGSTASGTTVDGPVREGDADVTTLDLSTNTVRTDTLAESLQVDDHDSPTILALPNGKVIASYTRHRADGLVRAAVRPAHTSAWEPLEPQRIATPVTYTNLVHLADEGPLGTLYNFTRVGLYPTTLRSGDLGTSWEQVGTLLKKYEARPYVVYDDDGSTRIDLATTEGHPREYASGTGIFHGYIEGGLLRTTTGYPVGNLSFGAAPDELTRVWLQTTTQRGWTADIVRVDGAPAPVIAFTVRDEAEGVPDHQRLSYHYATWDGARWTTSLIGFAGSQLFGFEAHYTGGIALDPADPTHAVLSTDVDPVSGEALPSGHHELFDAVTPDGGTTWQFTPITPGSVVDNLRPVIPDPTASTRALLWMRGEYRSFVDYDTEIVSIVAGGPGPGCLPPMDIKGPVPFSGDFDGDGLPDYVHYQPGGDPDTVFWGDGDRTVMAVNGTYEPIVIRPGGAASDDIIWSAPSSRSYRWQAQGHTFVSTPYTTESGSVPLVGDFDADGLDDVFHYRAGPGADVIRFGRGGLRSVSVRGSYRPFVGDFDGNGVSDVFWYAPGSGADYYWLFSSDGSIRSVRTNVNGVYRVGVGDADGDGTDDVLWGLGGGRGYLWQHDRPSGPPSHTSIVQL